MAIPPRRTTRKQGPQFGNDFFKRFELDSSMSFSQASVVLVDKGCDINLLVDNHDRIQRYWSIYKKRRTMKEQAKKLQRAVPEEAKNELPGYYKADLIKIKESREHAVAVAASAAAAFAAGEAVFGKRKQRESAGDVVLNGHTSPRHSRHKNTSQPHHGQGTCPPLVAPRQTRAARCRPTEDDWHHQMARQAFQVHQQQYMTQQEHRQQHLPPREHPITQQEHRLKQSPLRQHPTTQQEHRLQHLPLRDCHVAQQEHQQQHVPQQQEFMHRHQYQQRAQEYWLQQEYRALQNPFEEWLAPSEPLTEEIVDRVVAKRIDRLQKFIAEKTLPASRDFVVGSFKGLLEVDPHEAGKALVDMKGLHTDFHKAQMLAQASAGEKQCNSGIKDLVFADISQIDPIKETYSVLQEGGVGSKTSLKNMSHSQKWMAGTVPKDVFTKLMEELSGMGATFDKKQCVFLENTKGKNAMAAIEKGYEALYSALGTTRNLEVLKEAQQKGWQAAWLFSLGEQNPLFHERELPPMAGLVCSFLVTIELPSAKKSQELNLHLLSTIQLETPKGPLKFHVYSIERQ